MSQANHDHRQLPTAPPSAVATPEQAENPEKQKNSLAKEAGEKGNEEKRWQNLECGRGIELLFAFCLVVFTAGQVHFGHLQWRSMDEQNRKLDASIKLTNDSNVSAERSARAAEESAAAARASGADAAESLELAAEANRVAMISAKAAQAAADTMKTSLNIADDTAKRELRAYVSIEDSRLSVVQATDGSSGLIATLQLRNTGKTPAHNVTGRVGFLFAEQLDQVTPDPQIPLNGSGMTIGPSRPWSIEISYQPTAKVREEMKRLEGKFQVFGQITYFDAFGDKHFTNFRFRQGYSPNLPDGTFLLLFEDGGNESD